MTPTCPACGKPMERIEADDFAPYYGCECGEMRTVREIEDVPDQLTFEAMRDREFADKT